MSSRFRVVAWVGAVALTVAVAALGIAAGSGTAQAKSPSDTLVTFRVALIDKPDSLNPYTGIEGTSYDMWYLMYPTLTTPSEQDLSSSPALATHWRTSARLAWSC